MLNLFPHFRWISPGCMSCKQYHSTSFSYKESRESTFPLSFFFSLPLVYYYQPKVKKKKKVVGNIALKHLKKTNIFIYLVNYERNLLLRSPFCKSFIVNWNLVNTRALYELASGPVCLLQTVTESKAKDAFTLLLKDGASLSLQLKMLPPILCGTHYSSDR